jgi:hypothetical protein
MLYFVKFEKTFTRLLNLHKSNDFIPEEWLKNILKLVYLSALWSLVWECGISGEKGVKPLMCVKSGSVDRRSAPVLPW